MTQPTVEVHTLVVGAGPVGLACAIALAMAGVQVTLLERREGTLDKACGEGIMPAGVTALETLGVGVREAGGWPFAGIRYIDGPYRAVGRFPMAPGLGMRRTKLIAALQQRAQELGITRIEGCKVLHLTQDANHVHVVTNEATYRAQTLVAADGLHSPLRRQLGLGAAPASASTHRYGVRRHYACAPWSDCVDVHWADGAEAYITPVGDACVGVAFLWGPKSTSFEDLLQRFPAVAARLVGAQPLGPPRGAGPLAQSTRGQVAGRVVLVGDAAGYLDALTGEGLTLGFLSALALAPIVAQGRPLHAFAAAYGKLSAPYYREASALLALARRPRLRRWAMRLLCWAPRLMQAFVTAHGHRRLPRPRDFRKLVQVPPALHK